jgi:serine phosphatase RsbU (regulator of sigma subunit)
LYTDGLVEAKNNQNEEYGYKKVIDTAQEVMHKSPVEIVKSTIQSMDDFCDKIIPEDDITCLCIKFN